MCIIIKIILYLYYIMHPEARNFLDYIYNTYLSKQYYPVVLDVGSGDINGNNRQYCPNSIYIGVDIAAGPNVDIVSKCHELPYKDNTFDLIISSECFEHDMYYEQSIQKIMHLLKPGGLFVFTCASTGREEHGTLKCHAFASFTTKINDIQWNNYYKNLTKNDIINIPDFNNTFNYYQFYYNSYMHDLYFIGIKQGNTNIFNNNIYNGNSIDLI